MVLPCLSSAELTYMRLGMSVTLDANLPLQCGLSELISSMCDSDHCGHKEGVVRCSIPFSARKVHCKTVVFGRFWKARSGVSAILACEARAPHTPTGRVGRENDCWLFIQRIRSKRGSYNFTEVTEITSQLHLHLTTVVKRKSIWANPTFWWESRFRLCAKFTWKSETLQRSTRKNEIIINSSAITPPWPKGWSQVISSVSRCDYPLSHFGYRSNDFPTNCALPSCLYFLPWSQRDRSKVFWSRPSFSPHRLWSRWSQPDHGEITAWSRCFISIIQVFFFCDHGVITAWSRVKSFYPVITHSDHAYIFTGGLRRDVFHLLWFSCQYVLQININSHLLVCNLIKYSVYFLTKLCCF